MNRSLRSPLLLTSFLLLCVALLAARLSFAEPTAERFATALVTVESSIDRDGRTVPMLGDARVGTGVVLDAQGLIVTAGYLLLEANEVTITFYDGTQAVATVVAIDSVSDLALLRVDQSISGDMPVLRPVRLGRSALVVTDERLVVLPAGGLEAAASVRVHSVREFAAPWEYLLDEAIYTMPPVQNFSGAALINRQAELVGIGTLALQDVATSAGVAVPGNVFIPTDLLTSRLGLMLAGQTENQPVRGWLGLMIDESLVVSRVFDGAPAMQAGVQAGDIVLGLNDTHVTSRADVYQSLWAMAPHTDDVQLLVSRDGRLLPLSVAPINRSDWLVNQSMTK